ncbi:putative glucoside xylosyltransferase 1 isoform X3 [Penaeus vannamei]|uniref:UDP-D-xylose:beta-D-glucoside alpha-1,3-D-xylosyltransferase n=1 Tax=Penaeus vannamei TaxID=6689 RepID=A0A423SUZ8_PENVA|nr:putative glucoside xylosyltransferase 1 isoform X3 [Penaeus vannamei]
MFIRIQRQLRRNPTLVVLVTLTLWWSAACMFVYTARASSFVGNSDISLDLEDEYEFVDGRRTRMHREKLSRRGKYKQVQERVSNFSMDLPKLYLDTRRVEENGLKQKQIEVSAPPPPENTSTATHPENLASLRTLVTIVCGTQQRPDEYQRNIFGRQLNQTKAMLKSLVYFSTFTAFRIILVTDTVDTYTQVLQQIEDWPAKYRSRLHLERAELWTPSSQSDPLLLQRWRPCSWSKLFLLESLPFVDSAVYVDTDILFLAPAEGLWDVLEELEAPQALALGPDPLYDRHKHRRYAGSVGLSAGLMVMDLAALRAFRGKHGNFTQTILYYKNSFENYHDQDTLNVFLADHPTSCTSSAPVGLQPEPVPGRRPLLLHRNGRSGVTRLRRHLRQGNRNGLPGDLRAPPRAGPRRRQRERPPARPRGAVPPRGPPRPRVHVQEDEETS